MRVLVVAGLIIISAVTASILLPGSGSQAASLEVVRQNSVIEQQAPPSGNSSATITITMTGIGS